MALWAILAFSARVALWCVENLNTYHTAMCTGCGGHVMCKSVEWTDLLLWRWCAVNFFCSLSTNDGLVSAKWCLVWPRLMDSVHLLADLHGWWTRKRKQEVLKTTSKNVSWIGDTSSYWGLFGAEICVNTYHKKPVARAVHASMRLLHFRCCSQPLIGSPDGFSLLANVKLCSFTVKAC